MSDATKALTIGLKSITPRAHALAKIVHNGQLIQQERSILTQLFQVT